MKHELYSIAFRVEAVAAATAITVRARRGFNRHVGGAQVIVPDIHLLDFIQDKSNMIETLVVTGIEIGRRAMQGQIIVAAGEIKIVLIGPPFNGHAHQAHIKLLTGFQVLHL
jgi:hypothetical protein